MNTVFVRVLPRFAAVLLLCSLFLSGCGQDAPPARKEGEKPLIGILMYRKEDVFISSVRDRIRAGLASAATVRVEYAQHDQYLQNEQFDALIAKKAAALVVNLVDPQAVSGFVDKAKKAGIPLVFFNREPDLKILKTYDKTCFVGTAAAEAGIMQGDIIAKLWREHPEFDRNKDGRFQYVMFQGDADNPEAIARTEYSVKRANELGVPMQQVGETYICNWDEKLGKQSMQAALEQYGDSVELVISNNDTMALGAIAALQERGFNKEGGAPGKFIPVLGIDAVPQAVAAVKKKVMSATIKQNGEVMGAAIAAMTLNAVAGKKFLEGVPHAWDASGIAVRIPYSPYSGE